MVATHSPDSSQPKSITNARIQRIAIIGGTHGNEVTGVNVIKHYQENPQLARRHSFQTQLLFGNPDAIHANRRFIDKDLNRCFSKTVLNDQRQDTLNEVQRAKELAHTLHDVDFIIDLHTTTANMGVSLIFEHPNHLTHCILQQVAARIDDVYFAHEPIPDSPSGSHYLISCAPQGILIEVGPVAQSLMKATTYQKTLAAISATLDAIEAYNQSLTTPTPAQPTIMP